MRGSKPTRPAHEKDGGENVDRAGKAAEPRQMEAHDGDVHADSDATAERRVDGPPNTSADLHVDTTQEKQERWRQQHEAFGELGEGLTRGQNR